MHAFKIAFRRIRHHWHGDFSHVAEFFEGNAHAMDGRSLRPIHLIVSLGGPYISVIHCLQQARLEIRDLVQGLRRPFNDVSRGCSVDDIVDCAAVAAKAVEQGLARIPMTYEEEYQHAAAIIKSSRDLTQLMMDEGFIAATD